MQAHTPTCYSTDLYTRADREKHRDGTALSNHKGKSPGSVGRMKFLLQYPEMNVGNAHTTGL